MVEIRQEFACAGKRYRVKTTFEESGLDLVVIEDANHPARRAFIVPRQWFEALCVDGEGMSFEPRRMFNERRIQNTAEIIDNLVQVTPTVCAVYNAARAADINPHGDTAMREYLIQLYLENCAYRQRLKDNLESAPIVFSNKGRQEG